MEIVQKLCVVSGKGNEPRVIARSPEGDVAICNNKNEII